MSTTTFHCESCGAALGVRPAADFLSCVYCGTWSHLPSKLTPANPTPPPAVDPEVESELARIDREWDKEKEQYLIFSRDGRRQVVKPIHVLAGGMVLLFFLGGWDVLACVAAADQIADSESQPPFAWAPVLCLPLVGALATVVAVGALAEEFKRSLRYRAAYRRYKLRRAAISPLARRQVPGPCQVLGKSIGSNTWWMAEARAETHGLYHIHYRGWNDRYDTWVPREFVRFPEDEA
jgi:hypothetical protein